VEALMVSRGSKDYNITVTLRSWQKSSEPPHEALANLRDDAQAQWMFYERWGLVYPNQAAIESAPSLPANPSIEMIRSVMPELPPDHAIALRDLLRKAWRGDFDSIDLIERSIREPSVHRWVFERRTIELVPGDLWTLICVLFLWDRERRRLAICANPDCISPYFIKKRKTQKYCVAGSCTEQAQREQKRLWWVEHYGKRSKAS
jgi:hypothetical protein